MRLRTASLALGVGALLFAGGALTQRRNIERRWVEHHRAATDAEARAFLAAALDHPDKFLRLDAAWFLARLGDGRGFRVLEREIHGHNAVARYTAAWSLRLFEERALPLLTAAAEDDQIFVRERAVEALGYMRCEGAYALLRQAWKENVRVKPTVTLDAMWRAIPHEAAAITIAEVQHPSRLSLQEAIDQWMTHRRRLSGPDVEQRAAYDAIVRAVSTAPDFAGRVDPTWATHFRKAQARVERWDAEKDALRAFAGSQYRDAQRALSLRQLAEDVPESFDLDILRTRLRNPDPNARLDAAMRMIGTPTPAAITAADEELSHEPTVHVQMALLTLLLKDAPATAAPYLRAALQSTDRAPRSEAARLARRFPHAALVSAYEAGLHSEFGYVRLAVVQALNEVAHEDRRRLLVRAMHDPDLEIRVQAAGGLLLPW